MKKTRPRRIARAQEVLKMKPSDFFTPERVRAAGVINPETFITRLSSLWRDQVWKDSGVNVPGWLKNQPDVWCVGDIIKLGLHKISYQRRIGKLTSDRLVKVFRYYGIAFE